MNPRELNRALLARQHLIEPYDGDVLDLVAHLVGLQAQAPTAPYLQLRSRTARFDPGTVSAALTDRRLVRAVLMRSTLHLVTARDGVALRPLVQPALDRDLRSRRSGLDDDAGAAVVERARELLDGTVLTHAELGSELARQWPDEPATELVYRARTGLTLVQPPPRGLWGRSGTTSHTLATSWVGEHEPAGPDELVRRYLRAFGPATVADVQAWAGVTGLREVVERMDDLERFDDGLLDVPDAPRPDPDVEVPVRLVAEFDNVLLSHADRSRVIDDEHRRALVTKNGQVRPTVLIDGRVAGAWSRPAPKRKADPARITLEPWVRWRAADRRAAEREAHALLADLEPDRAHEVTVAS